MKQSSTAAPLTVPNAPESQLAGLRVCMHVLGRARTDVRVLREAAALAAAGAAVSIVDIESERDRPREEELQGIWLKHLKSPGWFIRTRFKPWFLVKASRMLCRGAIALLRTPADVYHAHDYTALPACYLAAVLRRKRLVFDAHELPLVDPTITRWPVLPQMAIALMRRMMPRCDGVITVSPPIVQEIQRRYGGRLAVLVRNIPIYQEAPPPGDQIRRSLGLGPETRIALYQGGLQPNRSLDKLVSAAQYLASHTVIVLMGKGGSQAQLEALIKQEQLGERVKIIPPVPYAELLEWTASADLGLIIYDRHYSPNVQMCLPNKLFEYLMVGLPVLASSLDAVAELMSTYKFGAIVDSLEPEKVGQAINTLLSDRAALAQMRRNALVAMQRDLHWEAESERLVHLYQQFVGVKA